MTTDRLYYGGIIPDDFKVTWYADIKRWYDQNLYNQLALQLCTFREVDPTTEKYEITYQDISQGEVRPKARSVAGDNVSVSGGSAEYRISRWPTGFILNEDDIKKDPRLQSWHVEACTAKIYYAQDKAFIKGNSEAGILGLQNAAAANPNGAISNSENGGAWLTDDGARGIYQDMLNLRGLIDAKYKNNLRNLRVICNSTSADAFYQEDPQSSNGALIFEKVARLLGRSADEPVTNWLIVNDQVPDNYVYMMAISPEVVELVQANPIIIDDNYPRQPIGNLQVVMYTDFGIAFHAPYTGIAELAID